MSLSIESTPGDPGSCPRSIAVIATANCRGMLWGSLYMCRAPQMVNGPRRPYISEA